MTRVAIVDYGLGNLLSVARAVEKCGAEADFVQTAEAVSGAERLVLPGVGAFANGMEGLRERGLVEPLRDYARTGRPFLAICLGMQMLMEVSEEFGTHEGLGLVPGRVRAIDPATIEGAPHKIPHIGWNELRPSNGDETWNKSVLRDVEQGSYAYFVHSFAVEPSDDSYRVADCYYDGRRISAVIQSNNIFGCQFHPEKSGDTGLRVMRRFTEMSA